MLRIISLLILVLTAALPAGADDAPATGFIYGTVLTHDDEAHTGFLRWDQEEAFWDDLFHSLRKDYPWYEYVDKDELTEERRHAYYRKHGLLDRLVWALFGRDEKIETSRIFICRFGDIRRLTVTGDYAADVETRDGTTHNVAGYSNDVGGTVFVLSTDGHGDRIELDWDEIDTIDFKNTPPWAEASALRLYRHRGNRRPRPSKVSSSGTSQNARPPTSSTARPTGVTRISRWATSSPSSGTGRGRRTSSSRTDRPCACREPTTSIPTTAAS